MHDEIHLGRHAADYAVDGLAVFPVVWLNEDGSCGCGKIQCSSPGKHPLTKNGLHDASTDEDQVSTWWKRWPLANIGIATGEPSGRIVLDIDADKGGLVTWDELQADAGQVEASTVVTGGGGLHLWFEYTGQIGNRAGMRQGIDFRGDGGYVVAPPSRHMSGRRYDWRIPWSPAEDEAYADRVMPVWLEAIVREKIEGPREVPAFSAEVNEWDGSTPPEVEAVVDSDDRARKLFRRDKRLKLEGGDASSCDFALACRLYEQGVIDPQTLAFGIMASRQRDAEAWRQASQRKGRTYYADTATAAIAKVEQARAALDRKRIETHKAWQTNYHWNEIGDADRFLEMHGPDLVYQAIDKRWYVWDGGVFAGDDVRRGGHMGIDLRIREFLAEYENIVAFQKYAEAKDQASKYALSVGTSGRLESIKKLCRASRARAEDQLDFEATLINAPNGVVDLETGKLMPHDRSHLMTRMLGAPYLAGYRSKRWETFLEQSIPDPEMREFFGLCVGYSLLGTQHEQRFFFVYGPGATGKSTAIKAIQSALGTYHRAADFSTFLAQSNKNPSGPSSDLARLSRVRMVSAVEVGHGQSLNDGLIKQLSGGDRVTSRKLYGDEQEWEPVMSLWLVANDRPKGRVDDDALWRRLVPFKFDQVVTAGASDARLTEKLTQPQERIGILAWAVDYARRYLEQGHLTLPAQCVEWVESYKRHSNPTQEFLDDCVEEDPLVRILRSELWKAYKTWCSDNEERGVTKRTFNDIVAKFDYVEPVCSGGYNYWKGIDLKTGR
jgi:putative DNA primase/helicase